MNTCSHCNYHGKPRLESAWLAGLALLVWLVPLGFLSKGFWPFFILPSIVITIWAMQVVRRVCPGCGQKWK